MQTSKNGIDLIKRYEGCYLKAYKCPGGVWTIGYGCTKNVKQGMTITKKQAIDYLMRDLVQIEKGIVHLVKVSINQNQFDALVSFVFNCGLGNFKRSTLLKKINNNDFIAASEEFIRWNKSNGKVLKGLTRRRLEERDLFLKPIYKYLSNKTYKGKSIVEALEEINVNSSYSYRKKLAKANGISCYVGTPIQNIRLLNLLKSGKLIKD